MLDKKLRIRRFNKVLREHQKWWEHMKYGAYFDEQYADALHSMRDISVDRSISGVIDMSYHSKMEIARANVGMLESKPLEIIQKQLGLSLSYKITMQGLARLVCKVRSKPHNPIFKYQDSSNTIAEGLLLALLLNDVKAALYLRNFLKEVRENKADSTAPCDQSYLHLSLFLTAVQLGEPLPELKAVRGYELIMQSFKEKGDLTEGIIESLDYHLSCAVEANDVHKEMDACFEPPSVDAFHHIHTQMFPLEIYAVMSVAKRSNITWSDIGHPLLQLYDYSPLLDFHQSPRESNELIESGIMLLNEHDIECKLL